MLLRHFEVSYFRKTLKKGKVCTFYIGECKFFGEITDLADRIASIRYLDGDGVNFVQRPMDEIFP
jgi:hypothetical protein